MSFTPTPDFQQLAVTLTERDREQQRIESVAGGIAILRGTITYNGYGDSVVAVPFPMVFIEHPCFTDGSELADSSPYQQGQIPIARGTVLTWRFKSRAESAGQLLYSGASIGIHTTGQPEQTMIYHYRFEAKALVNPT